jgi:uncharacterized protein YdeI (YjbR/CyaY-like superfamily)
VTVTWYVGAAGTASTSQRTDERLHDRTEHLQFRVPDVPEELAAATAADTKAHAFWDTLSYSKRQWHVLQVTSAETDATRERRIEKSVGMLREGRAR